MGKTLFALIAAALTAASALAADPGPSKMTVVANGTPVSDIEVALAAANDPKHVGTTNAIGEIDLAFSGANFGKKRVQLIAEECPDEKTRILIALETAQLPDKDRCKRRVLGIFWWHRARMLRVDLTRNLVATGESFWTKPHIGMVAGGAGAVAVALAAGGGSSTAAATGATAVTTPQTPVTTPPTTPTAPTPPPSISGNASFDVTTVFLSGDRSHESPTGFTGVRLVVAFEPSTGTISFSAVQPWTGVTGSFDKTTGAFSTTGSGTIAGVPNVSVRFTGTITAAGALSGDCVVGAAGELPGRTSITFRITGQKR